MALVDDPPPSHLNTLAVSGQRELVLITPACSFGGRVLLWATDAHDFNMNPFARLLVEDFEAMISVAALLVFVSFHNRAPNCDARIIVNDGASETAWRVKVWPNRCI